MKSVKLAWIPVVLIFASAAFGQVSLENNLPYKDLIFPQLAAGGGYETWMTVTNHGVATWNGTFYFYHNLGEPWNPIVNGVQISDGMLPVSIMSKERSNAVRMDLSTDRVVITSSNPDMGEAQDEIAVVYSGEELSMGFNARYLIDILAAMSSDNIILEMQAPLSPVLVKDEKDEGYRCVIMPMRI